MRPSCPTSSTAPVITWFSICSCTSRSTEEKFPLSFISRAPFFFFDFFCADFNGFCSGGDAKEQAGNKMAREKMIVLDRDFMETLSVCYKPKAKAIRGVALHQGTNVLVPAVTRQDEQFYRAFF